MSQTYTLWQEDNSLFKLAGLSPRRRFKSAPEPVSQRRSSNTSLIFSIISALVLQAERSGKNYTYTKLNLYLYKTELYLY